MRKSLILLVVLVCSLAGFGQDATEGSLFAVGNKGVPLGACPLKTTAVKTDISGFLARVNVRQEFQNPFTEPIEAVYVFPLSQNGAVDRMTMTVGTRVIHGKIMKREEARAVYETAKTEGKTAALLDQERPNIFTQSVANIMPGESIVVEISYVETLNYEDGAYEFVFPMTVGPRYIPAGVKDAAKISPPIAQTRAGHDVSIEVNLNAGVPVEEIRSTSHVIDQVNLSPSAAKITLRDEKTIPNKDFILRYDVTGKRIEDAVLAHRDERGGFFTMILQPPDKFATEDRTPKEIVFVLDTSGSMSGFPIEKAKEAMRLSLDGLYPDDTFNLIAFAGDTQILFDKPVPATQANMEAAQKFLTEQYGGGGTEMMTAIKAALDPTDAQDHLRIVCFMTDGFVGNENEIIAEVQKHPNARVFSFGIGNSVNRFLLDKIAQEGRGEAEYVGLKDDGSRAAKLFYERVRTPLLTDLSIDWNGMPVADTYPGRLTDLFTAKPVILSGRYTKGASGTIKLRGKVAGQPYERTINVNLPESETANDVLATLWARTRIDDLSSSRLKAADEAKGKAIDATITNVGLEYGLLTNFTSFVAVEDRVVNQNGQSVTVQVPVELPEGVDRQATVGSVDQTTNTVGANITSRQVSNLPINGRQLSGLITIAPAVARSGLRNTSPAVASSANSGSGTGTGYGTGSGSGYGSGSGTASGAAAAAPAGQSAQVTVAASSELIQTSYSATVDVVGTSPANNPSMGTTTIRPSETGTTATFPSTVRPEPEFQIDGASGSGNSFILDASELKRAGAPKVISTGILNGRALNVPAPEYPADALAVKAKGPVAVQILIDGNGSVTSATAVSGHRLLRDAAVKAAMATTFTPTVIQDHAVRLTGVIVYNFADSGAATISVKRMKIAQLSPIDKRRLRMGEKLHTWLYAVVGRVAKNEEKPTANEALFVHDGKADIQIELTTRNVGVIDKLKAAGFEIVSEGDKTTIVGCIALDKIAGLTDIDEVKLILPKI